MIKNSNLKSSMEEKAERELIFVNISGADQSGLTAILTEILARYEAAVLDIGQADIHHNLCLGILFMTDSRRSGEIIKELLLTTAKLKVQVTFSIVSDEEYNDWVGRQGKDRYIITIIGRKITAEQICATSKVIAGQGLNIDAITRLTGRIPLDDKQQPATKACIEFSVRGTPKSLLKMQEEFMSLSRRLNYDISLQEDTIYRRSRRLICFDMDSTLIRTEVIDELADRAGVGKEVRAITESAMRGEIDFQESFKRRVALLGSQLLTETRSTQLRYNI